MLAWERVPQDLPCHENAIIFPVQRTIDLGQATTLEMGTGSQISLPKTSNILRTVPVILGMSTFPGTTATQGQTGKDVSPTNLKIQLRETKSLKQLHTRHT